MNDSQPRSDGSAQPWQPSGGFQPPTWQQPPSFPAGSGQPGSAAQPAPSPYGDAYAAGTPYTQPAPTAWDQPDPTPAPSFPGYGSTHPGPTPQPYTIENPAIAPRRIRRTSSPTREDQVARIIQGLGWILLPTMWILDYSHSHWIWPLFVAWIFLCRPLARSIAKLLTRRK